MKAIRIHGPQDIRLHEEPLPVPEAGEALVRVGAVGLCGSDLHWFDEGGIGDARLDRPLVLGHEFAGVAESGRYTGQLVAVDPAIPCGQCVYCQQGNPNLCPTLRFAGHGKTDGGLREWVAWPEAQLVPLPPGFTTADGALLEPLGVALYSADLSNIRPGMSVGVFGCGPIGLMILQLALHSGATQVVATDKLPHRLAAAESFGARSILANGEEAEEAIRLTHGDGLDVVIEAAGSNAAVEAALAAVKPGGKVTLVGIPPDDRTSVAASVVRRKGLALQWVRRMKHTYPRAISLVRQSLIDVRSLVSHTYALEDAPAAFVNAQSRQGLKTVIHMSGEAV